MLLPPGTILQNRYAIEHLVAQGGMGAVYKATDQRLRNAIALKQILVTDPKLVKAFEREARLLASLHHPALPTVSDHFTEGDGQYLVMQFIPGDDLGTMLEKNRGLFTAEGGIAQVFQWADQLLDALDYLHSQKPPIIHRDIKPKNLKLSAHGGIILLDFGLAKGKKGTSIQSLYTTTDQSVRAFTAEYAPLEQIQGTGTEARSDLYSLAATLYHLLTDEAPPDALTRTAAALSKLPDPLRPAHDLNPLILPAVSVILHQALSVGLTHRFARARAMRTTLRTALQSSTPSSQPSAPLNSSGQATIVTSAANHVELSPHSPAATIVPIAHTDTSITQTLIVSKQGQGHHRTIGEALAAARSGARILVRPGIYREGLIITKPVEIMADGEPTEIVIESAESHALLMQADYALVRGLTLRGKHDHSPAVEIPQGRLVMEDCTITSETLTALSIHGSTANPVFWHCQIHDGNAGGIIFADHARGSLEECTIFNHAGIGILVKQGSNPLIRGCEIYQNKQHGMVFDEQGAGMLEESTIRNNGGVGIEISHGSVPFIRRCKIHDQANGYGVYICNRGEGILEGCDISANVPAGVGITQGGNPLLRRCRIHHHHGKQGGILAWKQGGGTIESCIIIANLPAGVTIGQGSTPVVRDCKIQRNGIGVFVLEGGGGTVEGCDLTSNTHRAWFIKNETEAGCHVRRNGNKE